MDIAQYRELKQELRTKKKELEVFRDMHGERLGNLTDDFTSLGFYAPFAKTLNQHMCHDIRDNLDAFYKWHKIRAVNGKKLVKLSLKGAHERMEKEAREKREVVKAQKNKAKVISAAVYKNFWGGAFRLLKVIYEKKLKVSQKKEQDRRVNEFLKLQSDLADEILTDIQNAKTTEVDKGPGGIILHIKKCKRTYKFIEARKAEPEKAKLSLFRGDLRSYQQTGVEWLNTLSQKQVSCILADEMGLGKTVQTIAHLSHLAENMGIWGPHLIVVPTTVLGNWLEELHRFLPGFRVFAYFGRSADRKLKRKGWSDIERFNICLTTYRVISIDAKIFKRRRWFTMVLDEAHLIKNAKTHLFHTLNKIRTMHRVLLTGTPLQNKLQELWTLMTFLFPSSFGKRNSFICNFDYYLEKAAKSNSTAYTTVISKLHSILRPLILRRLKKDVEKQLPKKTEEIIECSMSRRQKLLYDQFIMRAGRETRGGFVQSLNILMQLRKICNHPDLVDEKIAESAGIYRSVTYYVPEFVQFRAYNKTVSLFEVNPVSKTIFMALICLSHYNLSQNKHLPQYRNIQLKKTADRIRWNLLRPRATRVGEIDYKTTVKVELDQISPNFKLFRSAQDMSDWVSRTHTLFIIYVTKTTSKGMSSNLDRPTKFTGRLVSPLPAIFSNNINSFIDDSGKMKALYQKLMQLRRENKKVLIFTQMTKMLDYLEQLLSYKGFSYVRLDGSIATDERQAIVQNFNENPKIMIFISSTRVGGIGINLTAANTVIFYDSDWNPAVDKQAQDRCHRIGQIRDVTVYRLVTSHTIEENILMTSSVKAKIDDIVMNKGNFTLNTLFNTLTKKNVVNGGENIGKMLGAVEDEEDKIVDEADNKSEESKNEKDDEVADFSDQIDIYEKEIELISTVMPPVYHYGLEILKLTGCVKHIEEEIRNEASEDETLTQDQENEMDNQGVTMKDVLTKRRMDIAGVEKDRFIDDYRKRIKVNVNHA